MSTTLVVGDIHGCIDSLDTLLSTIAAYRIETIVFLGDYIDRGPDSSTVVDRILALQQQYPRVITLMGNHEYMFIQYLSGRGRSLFLQAGGRQTLASYGVTAQAKETTQLLPSAHLAFYHGLLPYWENQHGIYVHAGLQPGRHLSLQSSEACLWIRDEFIHSTFDFGKKVIFGHTVFRRPLLEKNKIGIDTGAVYGGTLTALMLPEQHFFSVPGLQESPYVKEL